MPVSVSTVRIEHAAPPNWNAQLNCADCLLERLPSSVRQLGISTIRSRGMDMAVALRRSAARCSRIVVSERCEPPSSRPYLPLPAPERVSEPMSRMFFASTAMGLGRSFSYVRSSAAAVVSVVMLLSSFW